MQKKDEKKPLGRGRGQGLKRTTGPYSRALANMDDVPEVRPPKIELSDEQVSDDLIKEHTDSGSEGGVVIKTSNQSFRISTLSMASSEKMVIGNTENRLSEGGLIQEPVNVSSNNARAEVKMKINNLANKMTTLSVASEEPKANSNTEQSVTEVVHEKFVKDMAKDHLDVATLDHDEILRKSNLSPDAPEFVPLGFSSVASTTGSDDQDEESLEVEEIIEYCFLNMRKHPASFQDVMAVAKPLLKEALPDCSQQKRIVDKLYSCVMIDAYFSYGAVQILIELIVLEEKIYHSTDFRGCLLTMAKAESDRIKTDRNDNGKLINVLLFLSELYMQLIVGSKRLLIIGKAVIDVLKEVTLDGRIPLGERVSFVYQTIKLIGRNLDEDDPDILDCFYTYFRHACALEDTSIEPRTEYMIQYLEEQRSTRWPDTNRNNATANDNPLEELSHHQPQLLQDPEETGVLYGPDGQMITDEEQRFLNGCYSENNLLEGDLVQSEGAMDSDGDLTQSEGAMDSDMEEAFDEFLIYSNQVNLDHTEQFDRYEE